MVIQDSGTKASRPQETSSVAKEKPRRPAKAFIFQPEFASTRLSPARRTIQLGSNGRVFLLLTQRHYSYECKASAQDRPYVSRPSRSQQLRNPKLVPKLTNDSPNPLERKEGIADEQLAKAEAERARKREREEREEELIESSSKHPLHLLGETPGHLFLSGVAKVPIRRRTGACEGVLEITAAVAAAVTALSVNSHGGAQCHTTAAPLTRITMRDLTGLVMQRLDTPNAMMHPLGTCVETRWGPEVRLTLEISGPVSRGRRSQGRDRIVGQTSTILGGDATEVRVDGTMETHPLQGVNLGRNALESEA
ncbi:hypothetical protein EDB81DRAFT_883134 [Dactylonectria macrodidyma]|uniref:Uncharacterized protein n=1 Tax=Dactylonectria macrodidyma TaxID=307937 RepID=A0A9P9JA27_9HYPO|nr:hypothetical protein EDB81DRAFT_883134 [Dactylonectria macrodidyma]